MTKPDEYTELWLHYSRAAEAASDSFSRDQFQALADSYMMLAKSTKVLNRSAAILEALQQQRLG
jgi:hypothetical protein